TGTLTEGRPRLVDLVTEPGFDGQAVLAMLASVERASAHPLAAAIGDDALERQLPLAPVADFDSPVGKGVVGTVDGRVLLAGSARFLAEHGTDVAPVLAAAEARRGQAATVIFVAIDRRLAGFAAIADPVKGTT